MKRTGMMLVLVGATDEQKAQKVEEIVNGLAEVYPGRTAETAAGQEKEIPPVVVEAIINLPLMKSSLYRGINTVLSTSSDKETCKRYENAKVIIGKVEDGMFFLDQPENLIATAAEAFAKRIEEQDPEFFVSPQTLAGIISRRNDLEREGLLTAHTTTQVVARMIQTALKHQKIAYQALVQQTQDFVMIPETENAEPIAAAVATGLEHNIADVRWTASHVNLLEQTLEWFMAALDSELETEDTTIKSLETLITGVVVTKAENKEAVESLKSFLENLNSNTVVDKFFERLRATLKEATQTEAVTEVLEILDAKLETA